MPRDSQFHLRINKNIYTKLNKISKKEGRNISDVIREAIAEYLLTRNYLSAVSYTHLTLPTKRIV